MSDGPPVGSDSVAVVICHYNPTQNAYLRQLVLLCCVTLRRTAEDAACAEGMQLDVIVCDGSPAPDEALASQLQAQGFRYLHDGRQLSFGETYNLGVRATSACYIALMANDVLISATQVHKLIGEVQRPGIGCAIPYLTKADYITQVHRRSHIPRRCYPASMTLNVNVFRRDVLEALGGVPEELSGCFNDMVMFYRLRRKGLATVLANVGEVPHLAMVTRKISTNLAWDRDFAELPNLMPELFRHYRAGSKNAWASLYAGCAQRTPSRWLWALVSCVPWKMKQSQGVALWAARAEPLICCETGSWKRVFNRRK